GPPLGPVTCAFSDARGASRAVRAEQSRRSSAERIARLRNNARIVTAKVGKERRCSRSVPVARRQDAHGSLECSGGWILTVAEVAGFRAWPELHGGIRPRGDHSRRHLAAVRGRDLVI